MESPANAEMEESKTPQPELLSAKLKLETNLVTFSSNVLKVYTLQQGDDEKETGALLDLKLSTQFNGRILDVIKVPTGPFLTPNVSGKKASTKKDAQASARDARGNRRK